MLNIKKCRMKKILLSLIVFVAVSTSYAQITVNNLNLFVGDSVFQVHVDFQLPVYFALF